MGKFFTKFSRFFIIAIAYFWYCDIMIIVDFCFLSIYKKRGNENGKVCTSSGNQGTCGS